MSEQRALEVHVDLTSPTPPYAQVRDQLAALIQSGALARGDRLPTVRALAADLGVAPGTVARAYGQLETDGLVLGRRRFGTTVVFAGGDSTRARLEAAARRFTSAASNDGHSREEIRAAVEAALTDDVAAQETTTR